MRGAPDDEIAFCGACGTEVRGSARFCGACGADQRPFADDASEAQAEAIEAKAAEPCEPDPQAHAQGGDAPDPAAILDELARAIDGVSGLEKLEASPGGQLTTGVVGKLLGAAEAAYAAGLDEQATTALDAALSPGSASPAETAALAFATAREEDCEFRTLSVKGLEVRRIDFKGTRVEIEDLGIEIVATDAGALIPQPTGVDEPASLTIAAVDLQLFGPNIGADEELERVHARGFDDTGLWDPVLALAYELRILRRLLWGVGHCALTDRRAFGLVYQPDETPDWSRLSAERAAMPTSLILREDDGVPVGTVLVFSIDRLGFGEDDAEQKPPSAKLRVPLLAGRNIPDVTIDWGEVQLMIDARGVLDGQGEVRKPRKGEIAAVATEFAPSSGDDVADG